MSAKTKVITVEQEALKPWRGKIDLIDAALINHVIVRLFRRKHQKIILHKGQPLAWINYPTVRAENWLIDLTDRGLQSRFAKLADLGLLIRTQLSVGDNGSGKHRGSRAYYGIGLALKARFEDMDSSETVVDNSKTGTHGDVAHSYHPHGDVAHYHPHGDVAQSLSLSHSKRVRVGTPQPQSVRPKRPPSAGNPPPPNLELKRIPEDVAKIIETLSDWKKFRKDRERVGMRKIIREGGTLKPVIQSPSKTFRGQVEDQPLSFINRVKAIVRGGCEDGRVMGNCNG
ncbi:hypothetical protein ES703_53092 [subsurface metagenome]